MNFGAEFACAIQQEIVEQAALNRDFALVAGWELDNHFLTADGDELDAIQSPMWQAANSVGDSQSPQSGPASRVQTIAANFFARKFFALEQNCSQFSGGAKCRTC